MEQITEKKITHILTHFRPHADEECGKFLLQKFGYKKYPGIENAKMLFTDSSAERHKGMSAKELERKGIICIGVLDSKFNEHPNGGRERIKNECATTLIAKDLGIDEDDELKPILKFILNNDLNASGNMFSIAHVLKLFPENMYEISSQWFHRALMAKYNDPRESGDFSLQYIHMIMLEQEEEYADDWYGTGINIVVNNQRNVFLQTQKEIDNNQKITKKIETPSGRTLNVLGIKSDDENISGFARSKMGGGYDIVVVRNTSGNTIIQVSQKKGRLTLKNLARFINVAEQRKSGRFFETDWETLSKEGTIKNGVWFYFAKGEMLLNGSLTAQHTKPTQLTLQEILTCVETVFSGTFLSGNKKCPTESCNPSCVLYAYGLPQCRKVRYERFNAQ